MLGSCLRGAKGAWVGTGGLCRLVVRGPGWRGARSASFVAITRGDQTAVIEI